MINWFMILKEKQIKVFNYYYNKQLNKKDVIKIIEDFHSFKATKKLILTTEKDAIKLLNFKSNFNGKTNATHNVFFRLGTSLSKFHKETLKVCTFNFEVAFAKMESCCLVFKSYGVDNNYINNALSNFKKISN